MSPDWASLPILPLRCILEHLSTEDALAATSTCRHWRNSLLMYEGRKETLKLSAKCLEKNLFLTRMFKRYTRKLLIYLDCKEAELEKFLNFVLPQFFDTVELQELIFIGPSYVHEGQHVPYVKLKRIITESLIFKHSHCLQKLALMGCEIDTAKNDNDRYCHRHVEYYSRPLTFDGHDAGDVLFSSNNASLMVFSTLKHILLDYDQINTAAVETLANLSNFTHLSLNITGNRAVTLRPVDWNRVNHAYEKPLKVALNIISVPSKRFNDIIENVLVDGLTLTSLKVLFCKAVYTPLLAHVATRYQHCLRELVWADSPCALSRPVRRRAKPRPVHMDNYRHVNPFVLLCWQCAHLSRLVIHGYWVWQYDLLGFVRLRGSISHIEVSSVYDKQDKFQNLDEFIEEGTLRVLVGDSPPMMDPAYIHEVNAFAEFKWQPPRSLHAALRPSASPRQRADYVLREATRPLGVTLC